MATKPPTSNILPSLCVFPSFSFLSCSTPLIFIQVTDEKYDLAWQVCCPMFIVNLCPSVHPLYLRQFPPMYWQAEHGLSSKLRPCHPRPRQRNLDIESCWTPMILSLGYMESKYQWPQDQVSEIVYIDMWYLCISKCIRYCYQLVRK